MFGGKCTDSRENEEKRSMMDVIMSGLTSSSIERAFLTLISMIIECGWCEGIQLVSIPKSFPRMLLLP
jgi:hypothetical protein